MRWTDPLVWVIRGYQRLISRYTPPVCRFTPSCSHYALEALQVHGLLRGTPMAAWRILRCNPLFPSGHDPVPSLAAPCGCATGSEASGMNPGPSDPVFGPSRAGGEVSFEQ